VPSVASLIPTARRSPDWRSLLAAALPSLHDRMMVGLQFPDWNGMRLWQYAGCKRKGVTRANIAVHGDHYTFIALALSTKAIVAYRTGKRAARIRTFSFVIFASAWKGRREVRCRALRTCRQGGVIGIGRRPACRLTARRFHLGEHSIRRTGDLFTIYILNRVRAGAAHALPAGKSARVLRWGRGLAVRQGELRQS
jgi:hypothetical protein